MAQASLTPIRSLWTDADSSVISVNSANFDIRFSVSEMDLLQPFLFALNVLAQNEAARLLLIQRLRQENSGDPFARGRLINLPAISGDPARPFGGATFEGVPWGSSPVSGPSSDL